MKHLLAAFHRNADRIKVSSTISPREIRCLREKLQANAALSLSFSHDALKSKIIFQKLGKQSAVNLGRWNNGEMARTPRVRGSNLNVRTFTFPCDLCPLTAGL